MKFSFDAEQWAALTQAERARRCHLNAAIAQQIGATAPMKQAKAFKELASSWRFLAADIERRMELQKR